MSVRESFKETLNEIFSTGKKGEDWRDGVIWGLSEVYFVHNYISAHGNDRSLSRFFRALYYYSQPGIQKEGYYEEHHAAMIKAYEEFCAKEDTNN